MITQRKTTTGGSARVAAIPQRWPCGRNLPDFIRKRRGLHGSLLTPKTIATEAGQGLGHISARPANIERKALRIARCQLIADDAISRDTPNKSGRRIQNPDPPGSLLKEKTAV
jgi:phosphoribosylaminoimidazole-succinocarboxamide synthase